MFRKSIAEINKLTNEFPDDPYFLELKGQIYSENGYIKEAIKAYQKCLKIIPQSPLIMLALSGLYLESSDINKKRAALNTITNSSNATRQTIRSFLINLIAFQSADFESLLLKKFGLSHQIFLKDYIIPSGKDTTWKRGDAGADRSNIGTKKSTMHQSYIRWDTLAVLINDYLIVIPSLIN